MFPTPTLSRGPNCEALKGCVTFLLVEAPASVVKLYAAPSPLGVLAMRDQPLSTRRLPLCLKRGVLGAILFGGPQNVAG